MKYIARSSALIDFIKNICYNLYIKQKEEMYGKLYMAYVWATVFTNGDSGTAL